MKLLLTTFLLLFYASSSLSGEETKSWLVIISVAPELQKSFNQGGRLLIRFSGQNQKEPRQSADFTVGFTPKKWDGNHSFVLDSKQPEMLASGTFPASDLIYCQVDYKNNPDDAQDNAPGNWFSTIDSLAKPAKTNFTVTLNKVIPQEPISDHQFVKTIEIQSMLLSEFSGHPRFLKASMLLPSTFFDHPDQSFPVCYRAPGLNGRYTFCLLYTSPSPRDGLLSRMPSSA